MLNNLSIKCAFKSTYIHALTSLETLLAVIADSWTLSTLYAFTRLTNHSEFHTVITLLLKLREVRLVASHFPNVSDSVRPRFQPGTAELQNTPIQCHLKID